jgi:ribosomal-protein-alanine N-acetyltransferase
MKNLSEKEIKEILKIEKESFKYFYNLRKIKELLNEFEILTIKKNSRIVAFLFYKIEDDKIFIRRMAVLGNFQRKGLATKMILKIVNIANVNSIKKLYLYVRVSNKKGINFQKKSGFKKIEKVFSHFPDGEDAYLMERNL